MRVSIVIFALALAGCGSYPLGTVYPEKNQTVRERDADMLYCKDWAKVETDTDARRIATTAAALTVIGWPVAVMSGRDRERELFAQCMAERGYRVVKPQ